MYGKKVSAGELREGTHLWRQYDYSMYSNYLEGVDWYGYKKSVHGWNSGNFLNYTFNDYFAKFQEPKPIFNPVTPGEFSHVENKLWVLEQHALNDTLTPQKKTEWQPFASQLVYAFGNETAAMVWDQERKKWVVCGYVELEETFVKKEEATKMCASCASIGLQSPTRDPILGKDYILRGEPVSPTPEPTAVASYWEDYWKAIKDTYGVRVIRAESNDTDDLAIEVKAIDVNLFGETTVTSECEDGKSNPSCAAFCCYSDYRTSEFCGGNTDTCL